MLDNLTQRLARVMKNLRGEARLTEANITDALREVRLALLEADVALPVVKDFIAAVKEKAVGEEVIGSLSPGQALIGVVQREMTQLMGGASAGLNLAAQPPAVVLMAGLQGAAAPILLAWFFSPVLAYWISQPRPSLTDVSISTATSTRHARANPSLNPVSI